MLMVLEEAVDYGRFSKLKENCDGAQPFSFTATKVGDY